MSEKTSQAATANDPQNPTPARTTGFTTADKLTDLSPKSTNLSTKEDNSVTRKDKSSHRINVQTSRGRHTTTSKPSNTPNSKKQSKKPTKKSQQPRTTANNRELTTPPKISRLGVVECLKANLSLSQIAGKYGVTESAVGYHIKILKEQGIIRMAGYGTWEILESLKSEKKTTANQPYVGRKQPREEIQKNIFEYIPESIRSHAFAWTVEVPKNMRNWGNKKRVQYLDRHNIPYTPLGIFGGGQRLIILGHKVWLTNKSLVVYDTNSYFAETAIAAKSTAVHHLLSIIRNLERLLHTDFRTGDSWKFKPSRHHYAIIKNALAQQCDEEGLKLEVRTSDDNSLWMWIDNSYDLHETEFGHQDTAVGDTSAMQDFCNSVRDTKETMHSISDLRELQAIATELQVTTAKAISQVVGSQMAMAANTESHLELISNINAAVQDLTAAVQDLTKAAKNGTDKP